MHEVVLNLNRPNNWVSEVTREIPSQVRILDCKLTTDKNGVEKLVEIYAPDERIPEIIENVRKNKHIASTDLVRTKSGKVLGRVIVRDSMLCAAALGSEVFCRTCLFGSERKRDGQVEWTLALGGRESLEELLTKIKKSKEIGVKIARLTTIADKQGLTSRQMEILQTAVEKGFFDYPRKITVRQLAILLKAAPATISEILRSTHKKIVSEYLH